MGSSRDNDPGIDRGQTLFFWRTPTAAEIASREYLKGMRKTFEDVDYSSGQMNTLGTLSPEWVECMLVKNVSSAVLTAGQAVTFAPAAPFDITGPQVTLNDPETYIVDNFLPALGCPINDFCWVVTKGPCNANIVSSGTTAAGTPVAGSATSGRLGVQGAPANATEGRDQTYAVVAVLLAAAATGNTSVRVRVLPNLYR